MFYLPVFISVVDLHNELLNITSAFETLMEKRGVTNASRSHKSNPNDNQFSKNGYR